jgi:hypothetical protein
MSQLRRLAKIYYVVGKYRLDNLIDQRRLPLAVRLALAPSKLFRQQPTFSWPAPAPCPRGIRPYFY